MKNVKRILYAEDNPKDRELTLTALQEHNLANEVTCVGDGEEALDFLYRRGKYSGEEEYPLAAILLDIKMPKVDGIEVLRQIKSDNKLKHIPVVILTSSREERDLIESYQLGVNAYVVKPMEFSEFIDAVKNLGLFWALINETI
ncbi:MAG: two-component system response regulator [Stygiobacter sp. RIFOXYC12_FULL_38_8]|nr:MAG: response regulator receiver [Stygiobacter sp.]KAF0215548.1 MAG: response regulator [Ignavibacteria bacterium]OGU68814.1 MAG: two-component system response regulator [Stygiobacter sp. GWC2_38_9]OGU79146.1 MAG: two-component system response regulator [Stygiobacter sp. RIFOXYA12_FULL_38_9]OGV09741.1 MAG: two-component system response regulator [Stygiobacter sp. RIFOXYB2_FULL_37_11]OGV13609.1 MAG: two-component system response regulator [Stygiobacter sp. RIFOXYC2_FULL_38_25]OGV16113.1 MAG